MKLDTSLDEFIKKINKLYYMGRASVKKENFNWEKTFKELITLIKTEGIDAEETHNLRHLVEDLVLWCGRTWEMFDHKKAIEMLNSINEKNVAKRAFHFWELDKGIEPTQKKIDKMKKVSQKLPEKKLKLESTLFNWEDFANEGYNNGFTPELAKNFLIKTYWNNWAAGSTVVKQILWWKNVDFGKLEEILEELRTAKKIEKVFYKEALSAIPRGIKQSLEMNKETTDKSTKLPKKKLRLEAADWEKRYRNSTIVITGGYTDGHINQKEALRRTEKLFKEAKTAEMKYEIGLIPFTLILRATTDKRRRKQQGGESLFPDFDLKELLEALKKFNHPSYFQNYIRRLMKSDYLGIEEMNIINSFVKGDSQKLPSKPLKLKGFKKEVLEGLQEVKDTSKRIKLIKIKQNYPRPVEYHKILDKVIEDGYKFVIVDFKEVTTSIPHWIASFLFNDLLKKLMNKGGRLMLSSVSAGPKEMFNFMGYGSFFNFKSTTEEAIKAMNELMLKEDSQLQEDYLSKIDWATHMMLAKGFTKELFLDVLYYSYFDDQMANETGDLILHHIKVEDHSKLLSLLTEKFVMGIYEYLKTKSTFEGDWRKGDEDSLRDFIERVIHFIIRKIPKDLKQTETAIKELKNKASKLPTKKLKL